MCVLALAILLRFWNLAEWSMWEDEEGTVYYSQRIDKPFAQLFPVFFFALHVIYQVTGVTVAAGRVFAAVLGILGIVLVYSCFMHLVSRRVALLACFFLAINFGHLFWSQSIRYYNLVVVFQLLSMYWLVLGLERRNWVLLVLSLVTFVLGLWTHFSAILLAPAYLCYLGLLVSGRGLRYPIKIAYCLSYACGLLVVGVLFAWKLHEAQAMLSGVGGGLPSARNPLHVLMTVVAYFGLPLVMLGVVSPWFAPRDVPRRLVWFVYVVAVVPVLELPVIAKLNVINVTWYYALISLSAFAIAAAFTCVGLYQRGWRRAVVVSIGCSAVYFAIHLVAYNTTMFGDRPRWEEATIYLRQAAAIHVNKPDNPAVFASVPGVVAFYLGVDPGQTKPDSLVQMVPAAPSQSAPSRSQWYVVEAGHISDEYQAWLDKECALKAAFEAHTGPRDRTVRVYEYQPKKTLQPLN
jgi:4-amino-4-deoxy-L-arabinose transferase-like glycosyltransferase